MRLPNKVIQIETGRSNYYVSAAKRSGAPMDSVQNFNKWVKDHPEWASSSVYPKKSKR